MPSYKQAIELANKRTRRKNKETSATKLLMLHFSGLEPTELYIRYNEEMPKEKYEAYFIALDKYLEDNIPVQQIIGYVYFYGYKFIVDDQVLIPRFETEELVANILIFYDEYFGENPVDVVDIGTGSGCLAVSLKKEEPKNFHVTATDISEEALNVAKKNALLNKVEICFLSGDMLEPVKSKKFDILVSNPPYIPESEVVEDIILENEPHVALFGGSDGLKFYRKILSEAKNILKSKSIIGFEHGYDKANELQKIAKTYFPLSKIFTLKDMQGLDRMTFVITGFKEEISWRK